MPYPTGQATGHEHKNNKNVTYILTAEGGWRLKSAEDVVVVSNEANNSITAGADGGAFLELSHPTSEVSFGPQTINPRRVWTGLTGTDFTVPSDGVWAVVLCLFCDDDNKTGGRILLDGTAVALNGGDLPNLINSGANCTYVGAVTAGQLFTFEGAVDANDDQLSGVIRAARISATD